MAYLTGWEAGGHTVWAQTLRRPESWLAVAPVTTNYQRRGLTAETFSDAREPAALPIQVAPVRVVPGADHGPLEAPVMAWFDSLAQRKAEPTRSR